MTRVGRRGWVAGALSALALPEVLKVGVARADGLSGLELGVLGQGETVKRNADLEIDGVGYMGVLTYRRLASPPSAVLAVLSDPREGLHILPFALNSEEVRSPDEDRRFAVEVGSKLATASFVLRMRFESKTLVKFFLDPSFPHEIDDCYGFFRFEPAPGGGTFLTVAGLCDVGSAFIKLFLLELIRSNLFKIAERVDERARLRG